MPVLIGFCFVLVLSACSVPAPSGSRLALETPARLAAAHPAPIDRNSVWQRIKRAAQEMCQAETPENADTSCQFELIEDGTPSQTPNARSWIGPSGRTLIAINDALYARLKGAHEHAFILAHEAAHSIALHHSKQERQHLSAGFQLGRKRDPAAELEADAIGTILVIKAGFDPLSGSRILNRLYANRRGATGSHPSLTRRLSIVKRTYDIIRDGGEIKLDLLSSRTSRSGRLAQQAAVAGQESDI